MGADPGSGVGSGSGPGSGQCLGWDTVPGRGTVPGPDPILVPGLNPGLLRQSGTGMGSVAVPVSDPDLTSLDQYSVRY